MIHLLVPSIMVFLVILCARGVESQGCLVAEEKVEKVEKVEEVRLQALALRFSVWERHGTSLFTHNNL